MIVLALPSNPPKLSNRTDLAEIYGGRAQVKSRAELVAIMTSHFARAAHDGATMLEGGEAFILAQARAIAVIERILTEPDWQQPHCRP